MRAQLFLLLLLIPELSLATSLKVVSEAWAPYIFEQDGELRGIDYETVQQVLARLGHSSEWELVPWKRAMLSVSSGRADAILDILPTSARRQQLIFPAEYLSRNDSVLFYARKHPHPYNNLQSLRGLTLGVAPGYSYGSPAFMAADYFTREAAPSIEANLLKLLSQRIDLAVVDRRAGLHVRKQLNLQEQIGFDPQPIGSGKLYLAFHRGEGKLELSQAFSAELTQFKGSENYQRILTKYGLQESEN
ncbi:MAG TPA: transporter substrate-binding domain-containing protein [Pseudomonas sabulinigri]|uniref:Solute-binding protein family 3/N-terminal domain-containing protein n=1 Tax=marine sediment metagenome TaxID=412755 RepID=A0A0F9Y815_9ZZZZ|nr:transporter substrate-binding domain-containing protein [Halopseudomonas sabulinigri]HEC51876.1 transporter substrate-binding domain-containing protein [Halopseudomonas sabulinigri]